MICDYSILYKNGNLFMGNILSNVQTLNRLLFYLNSICLLQIKVRHN